MDRAWYLPFALATSVLLASHTPADASKSGQKSPQGLPSNYRQMIAQDFKKYQRLKVLKAEISRPGQWERLDGTFPLVCVRWSEEGPFRENLQRGYVFKSGKIAEQFNPESSVVGGVLGAAIVKAKTCGPLPHVPFPEIRSRK